jgi:uncharacterized SAM-binding protein YcdF (DUF218 family)
MLVNKILPILILPLGIALILTGVSAWRRSRKLALAAILWLAVLSMPVVGEGLLASLECRYPRLTIAAAPTADAIVVLGGILHEPRPGYALEWNDAVDRFERGVELYRAGKAPRIVFSGAALERTDLAASEGDLLRRAAIEHGVPEGAVIVTGRVGNTADEAWAGRALVDRNHWTRVLLVTSAFHMTRAMLLFRRAGVNAVPFPTDYYSRDSSAPHVFQLQRWLPQAESLAQSERALREYLGLVFYTVLHPGSARAGV